MRETFIAKTDINGNRKTLRVNHHKRVMCFTGSYCGDCGIVHTGLPIRAVERLSKDYYNNGYTIVHKSEDIEQYLS